MSKLLVGGFLLLRLSMLGLAGVGTARLCVEVWDRQFALQGAFLALGCVLIAIRTLFFGFYVVMAEFRYVSPARPFVLVAGLYCLAAGWRRRDMGGNPRQVGGPMVPAGG